MLSRVGISLDDDLLAKFDGLIEDKGYDNRSEAIRDLIREALVKKEWEVAADHQPRVAVVMLVYDHDQHDLGHQLMHEQHNNHEIVVSTMHVHMDHDNCLERLVLRGPARKVLRVGDSLVSTKGVKLGKLILASTGEDL